MLSNGGEGDHISYSHSHNCQ